MDAETLTEVVMRTGLAEMPFASFRTALTPVDLALHELTALPEGSSAA